MSTEYVLTYFDIQAWGESARLILSYGGANWKDNRIPFVAPGKSPIPDEVRARLRFGQMPLLEFDGKKIVQSMAICRYLAKKFNIAGKDDLEAAQADELTDACKDIFNMYKVHILEQDAEKKKAGIKETTTAVKQKFISKFNEAAEANNGFLVGSSMTWADIVVASYMKQLEKNTGAQLLQDFPALSKLVDRVFNSPGIKEYISKRPDTVL